MQLTTRTGEEVLLVPLRADPCHCIEQTQDIVGRQFRLGALMHERPPQVAAILPIR